MFPISIWKQPDRRTDGQWNMQKIVVEGKKKNCHVARRHKQHLVNMFVIHFVYDCFLFFYIYYFK